ncbi:hypothetical protein OHAE_1623 [Ochrobactrum soli]|uniref:Uncharacterized protein n=1 Tax=Ochrobactrum soli TaxID=2448455 RepID=A0A2P9HNP3_9HYPH|nr:hypothetical protein OHAE_1623 [[Ochrobactrum] soli]
MSASFGEDIEDIDSENEEDQNRAKRMNLLYPLYEKLMSDDELRKSLIEAVSEQDDLAAIH